MHKNKARERTRYRQSLYPHPLPDQGTAAATVIAICNGQMTDGTRIMQFEKGKLRELVPREAESVIVVVANEWPDLPRQAWRRPVRRWDYTAWASWAGISAPGLWRAAMHLRELKEVLGGDPLAYPTPAAYGAALLRDELYREGRREPIGQACTTLRRFVLQGLGGIPSYAPPGEYRGRFYLWDMASCYPYFAQQTSLPRDEDWLPIDPKHEDDFADGIALVDFQFPSSIQHPSISVWQNDMEEPQRPYEGYGIPATLSEIRMARALGARIHYSVGQAWGWLRQAGTWALARVLRRLARTAEERPHTAATVKRIALGLIGKLNQHYHHIDYAAFAKISGMPERIARTIGGIPGGNIITGGTYLPEWYYFITARARAAIWGVANRHNALYVFADSFITEDAYIVPCIGQIRLPPCRREARGDRLIIAGHGRYALFAGEQVVKEAHLGIHYNSKEEAHEFWAKWRDTTYSMAQRSRAVSCGRHERREDGGRADDQVTMGVAAV